MKNVLRIVASVAGFIALFAMMLVGKKPDLNPVRALWWNDEILKRIYNVAARMEQRVASDKEWLSRHQNRNKKVLRFVELAKLRRQLDTIF